MSPKTNASARHSLPHPPRPDLKRHSRKCQICHHPDRARIESYYIDWYPAIGIAGVFDVDDDAIARHASAFGLTERRQRNVRVSLERLIEQSCCLKATPDSVIRAVEAYTHIDDNGRWIATPNTHVVIRGSDSDSSLTPAHLDQSSPFPLDLHRETSHIDGQDAGFDPGPDPAVDAGNESDAQASAPNPIPNRETMGN